MGQPRKYLSGEMLNTLITRRRQFNFIHFCSIFLIKDYEQNISSLLSIQF